MILTITAGLRALVRFATAPLRREVGPQGHGGSGAGGIHGMRTGTAMSLLWFTMIDYHLLWFTMVDYNSLWLTMYNFEWFSMVDGR